MFINFSQSQQFAVSPVNTVNAGSIATTLALGEEGGTAPGQQGFNTTDVLQVFSEADRLTNQNGKPGLLPRGDGQLTRQELANYSQAIRNQVDLLNQMKSQGTGTVNASYYGYGVPNPSVNLYLDQQLAALQGRLNIATVLEQNFNTFAVADGGPLGGNPSTISLFDISIVSGRDGNSSNLTPRDLIPGQEVTTLALGEEGGGGTLPQPPVVTTQALGEEGGGGVFPQPPVVTTQALGEEGGGSVFPQPPVVTTQALGEEGGGYFPGQPPVTSLPYGENGGSYPSPLPTPAPAPSTLALGEEGGYYFF